MNILNFHVC